MCCHDFSLRLIYMLICADVVIKVCTMHVDVAVRRVWVFWKEWKSYHNKTGDYLWTTTQIFSKYVINQNASMLPGLLFKNDFVYVYIAHWEWFHLQLSNGTAAS